MSVNPDPRANRRVALISSGVALGMLGLAFASVPLYRIFCQVTGFGGTTQRAETAPAQVTDKIIKVRFDANVSSEMGWVFRPAVTSMEVKLGEISMAHYVAQNMTQQEVTGSAVFNVTPTEAGIYFNKIACFCFTQQTLKPGERVEMPVQFFVDPALLDDADTKHISEITLSYSFYPVKSKAAGEQAAVQTN
ncbi:MAG: cytochrome c oxidase assembly protein [Proteobacteria bacterium]|nr:cytochrome c oxidase assembly protein [Pseudomonadota bacterium]